MTVTGSETTPARMKLPKFLICCLPAGIGPQQVPGTLVSHVSRRFVSHLRFLSSRRRRVAFGSRNGITSVGSFTRPCPDAAGTAAPHSPGFHPLCSQAAPADWQLKDFNSYYKLWVYEHSLCPECKDVWTGKMG